VFNRTVFDTSSDFPSYIVSLLLQLQFLGEWGQGEGTEGTLKTLSVVVHRISFEAYVIFGVVNYLSVYDCLDSDLWNACHYQHPNLICLLLGLFVTCLTLLILLGIVKCYCTNTVMSC